MKLIFSHVNRTKNTGDLRCCPYFYYQQYFRGFDFDIVNLSDLHKKQIKNDDIVIIGGGGILDASRQWNVNINHALKHSRNVIIWGAGFNHGKTVNTQRLNMDKFALVGIRDFYRNFQFVPCVSCKSKFFDRQQKIKRQIGIVKHYGNGFRLNDSFNGVEMIFNDEKMSDIIRFINESDIILSDSYHGLFWSALAGKKVGRIRHDYNSRFEDCFYRYPYIDNLDNYQDCKSFSLTQNDLVFFRELNNAFMLKIRKIIEKK